MRKICPPPPTLKYLDTNVSVSIFIAFMLEDSHCQWKFIEWVSFSSQKIGPWSNNTGRIIVNGKIRYVNGTVLRRRGTARNTIVWLAKYGEFTGTSQHHTATVRYHG